MATVTAYPKHTNLIDGAEASISFSYSINDYTEKDLYTVFAKNAFDSIPDGSTINSIKFYFDAKYSKDSLSANNYERWRIYRWLRVNNWDGTYDNFNSFNNLSKTLMYEGGLETDTIGTSYAPYTLDISGLISLSVSDLKSGVFIWLQARRKGTLNATMYIKNFRIVIDYTPPSYYLDLNGTIDGSWINNISSYGTAEVYIKGSLVEGGPVSDYYAVHPYGTTYEIKNIRASDGYRYNKDSSGPLSGTITNATEVLLSFSTKCTIKYDGNGQTGGSVVDQPGYINEPLRLAQNGFEKSYDVILYKFENEYFETPHSDATFQGWCTSASGETNVGKGGDWYTPSGNETLYAKWSDMPEVELRTPIRDGYTFLGWYTKASGGTKVANGGDNYRPDKKSVTLYGHWKRNSINRIYIGTKKPKFYKGKKPIRSIYLGTSLIYKVFLPKISYDSIKTLGNLLVPLPEDTPKTYTLPEANLENAEGNVSYALYSDSKCKTPVGAGITFDENTRQVTISNEAKDTVAAQNTYKDGLAKFYVKATYKNLSAIGEITFENYKVTATFSYLNNKDEDVNLPVKVYYGTSVEEFANSITDFKPPENNKVCHYINNGWVDPYRESTIKSVKRNTTFVLDFIQLNHVIDPTIFGYEKKVPTCTESGYIKGYCGYCAKQENGYKGLIQVNSPATGHKDTNGDNICDVCGEIFVDSGACGDNLTYTLDSNGVLTISGTGDMQNSSFEWNKKQIKSVIINDGVTSIGNDAFSSCSGLTSVTIPDSVTSIGSSAFNGCSGLTSVTIPDSVTSIGSSAFSSCSGLTSLIIPDSVTNISDSAFSNCTSLTSVTIPDSIISIGDSAFSRCDGLTSLTIPDSVTSIGNSAFSDCYGLTSITIGNNVTSIGYGVFRNCYSLTDITVSSDNIAYHSTNNCLIETESKTLILGCKNSVIPSNGSVTDIGYQAFFYCTGLTNITIPNSVTSIGGSAFDFCRNLTEVNFSTRTDIPALESPDVFDNTPDNLAIKVPSDLVDQWKAATNWDAYADKIVGVRSKM